MDGDIIMLGMEAFGQWNAGGFAEFDIEDGVATIAIKMAMFGHVGTKAGCSTLQGHLFDQPALNKRR